MVPTPVNVTIPADAGTRAIYLRGTSLTLGRKNMCMVYYLGTDGAAPRIPWQESSPAFYVDDIEANVLPAVRQKLPHTNLVYIGSHEGCGCGFRRADDYIDEDENSAATKDHHALAEYLTTLPPSTRPPQIFGCWSGDEGTPIDHRREISAFDILNRTFGFQEREILTINQK